MTIQAGEKLPSVTFMHMSDAGPAPISTEELFGGKTVALFAVPGAFTPTCSNQHMPGYVQHAASIREKGVDTIVCLSVNDAFVMDAWGKDKGAEKILMLGDGNGDFTEATGLTMDGSGFGLGSRSLRYSMIIDDNTISKLNLESNPGEISESSAETILNQL
jgi:peroxiredoxin